MQDDDDKARAISIAEAIRQGHVPSDEEVRLLERVEVGLAYDLFFIRLALALARPNP